MRSSNSRYGLLLIILLYTSLVSGLSSDKDQPIHLEADSVEIDEATGISVYKGNVVITQGSLKLWTDTMWIHRRDSKTEKIIAEGSPTRFRQLMDDNQQEVRGRANRLEFFLEQDEIHLTGDAVLEQEQDQFRSDRIIYQRSKLLVKAGTSAQGKDRVHVVIEPDTPLQ